VDTNQTGNLRVVVVVGLGYVGLPLAVAFARAGHLVIGYDINEERVTQLRENLDVTGEVSPVDLLEAKPNIFYEHEYSGLFHHGQPDIYVVTVPTPVDKRNVPDLSCLKSACHAVGAAMYPGSIVVFESTVYPGCTEDVCVPLLEERSRFKCGQDFFVGYSPERVNPGDPFHKLKDITKILGCPNSRARAQLRDLYLSAGCNVVEFDDIRVCEAAKAIENAQRDINIAFMNELAMLFAKMGIDTKKVLDAAGTKWNFLKFTPGLVGGHCIGVDPYYLANVAQEYGFHPELILAGRRTNEAVAGHIAVRLFKRMWLSQPFDEFFRVLVLGRTFKENCPDTRNSKVESLVKELRELGCEVTVYDPYSLEPGAEPMALEDIYHPQWDGIVLAVPHDQFRGIDWLRVKRNHAVLFDVKSVLPDGVAELRL
jgi:UDP-N-acetyl-D-galactosamine dehydrogenase